MHRYFIHFSYDGTCYHGWQIQPNGNTVQAELQRSLSTLLRSDIEVVGAGRTDAGVHARHMVAHFDMEKPIDCRQTAYRLNRILPSDIAVSGIEEVGADCHARFSAISRRYRYFIHTSKNPFLRHYSCELHYTLDFDKMNEAASHLIQNDDFGAFCKSHTDVATTLCDVTKAQWVRNGEDEWYFEIQANRFLRNMVRAVVGTLIDVGRGRMSLEEFDAVVAGRQRTDAGESMPGNALFLEEVIY